MQITEQSKRNRQARPVARIARMIATVLVTTGVGLAFVLWWSDRELPRIEQLIERREYAEALKAADQFLGKHPDDLRAGLLKARALSGLGRHAEVDRLLSRLALKSNGFPDDEPALRAWADSLLHLKQWTRAIVILENLNDNHSPDADVLYKLTVARIRLRRLNAALESAKQLRDFPGNGDDANVLIGTIQHDLGNRREAVIAWKQVLNTNNDASGLRIAPGHFLMMIGVDLLETGQPKDAAKLLERSVSTRPDPATYTSLGKAYAQLNRQEDAISVWEKAIDLDPANTDARNELANAMLMQRKASEALVWLAPLKKSPRVSSTTSYLLQRTYTQLKNTSEVEKWKKRTEELRKSESIRETAIEAMRRNPAALTSRFIHIYQLAEEQRWDEAEQQIGELVKRQPTNQLVRDLETAIKSRGTLPSLAPLTGTQY